MRKIYITFIAVCLVFVAAGQQKLHFKDNLKEAKAPARLFYEPVKKVSPKNYTKAEKPEFKEGMSNIIIRDLGGAGNGFGMLGVRQYLWADDDINSIAFVHRMLNPPDGPGSGFLAYDYSTDGGLTWLVNNQIYDAELPNAFIARYPQGGIYNPPGNTDPYNSYYAYFAATLDGSNGGTWGGYCYGAQKFGSAQQATQHNLPSVGNFLQGVPSAYTISTAGRAMCADAAKIDSYISYTGNMIVTHGLFNPSIEDFEMESELVEMLGGGISPTGVEANVADVKVAFAPDGQIGYIGYLCNNGDNTPETDGCYYPILYKTTDGGVSWDGPYNVRLGGIDGIPGVWNYLTDEIIEKMFDPPIPDREDIPFTTAFEFYMSVDYSGNPHLIFNIGVGSQEWSIYTSYEGVTGCGGCVGMFHIFSLNGGEDWIGDTLCTIKTFRGEYPYTGGTPTSEDSRPFLASTMDGSKMFFSWTDTDIPDIGDNIQPDIYCVGHDVTFNKYSVVNNVTVFSNAMWQSYMACGSKFVKDNGNGSYTIPFVYQEINPDDLADPVQFHYIDNFVLTDADISVIPGEDEISAFGFYVSQNFPNPCRDYTTVMFKTDKAANVSYDVINITGQKVLEGKIKFYPAGSHSLTIRTADLTKGIYFYNVKIGDQTVTKKMIVE